jgi:hypothetical protein
MRSLLLVLFLAVLLPAEDIPAVGYLVSPDHSALEGEAVKPEFDPYLIVYIRVDTPGIYSIEVHYFSEKKRELEIADFTLAKEGVWYTRILMVRREKIQTVRVKRHEEKVSALAQMVQ